MPARLDDESWVDCFQKKAGDLFCVYFRIRQLIQTLSIWFDKKIKVRKTLCSHLKTIQVYVRIRDPVLMQRKKENIPLTKRASGVDWLSYS
jgi:hypothetical protein